MEIEKIIVDTLNTYFSDFKQYHLLILFLFAIIIAVIQIAQTIWVKNKIETFKSDLKKSEIKFSRYNEMQIKALSELYYLISDFNVATIDIGQDSNTKPETTRKLTKIWLEKYYLLSRYFGKNKFILIKEIKSKMNNIFHDFEQMKYLVKTENEFSHLFRTDEYGDLEFMGDIDELNEINDELKRFNKTAIYKNTSKNIKDLKLDIEKFFENLE